MRVWAIFCRTLPLPKNKLKRGKNGENNLAKKVYPLPIWWGLNSGPVSLKAKALTTDLWRMNDKRNIIAQSILLPITIPYK